MAKGQRLKPEQILTLLRQIDVLTTNGKTLAQACKEVDTTLLSPGLFRSGPPRFSIVHLLGYFF
ncbi:hypothetical protein G6678_05060 [Polynucleobacter paneuropaeus]|nr:hypothetical protein [Polynucleobacter meluiroseus]QWD32838.1 hypothetical protein G6678_05060 [Polynucleobacter paneuropaeus]